MDRVPFNLHQETHPPFFCKKIFTLHFPANAVQFYAKNNQADEPKNPSCQIAWHMRAHGIKQTDEKPAC